MALVTKMLFYQKGISLRSIKMLDSYFCLAFTKSNLQIIFFQLTKYHTAMITFLYPVTEREKLNAQIVFALPALFMKIIDNYGGLRETKIQNV